MKSAIFILGVLLAGSLAYAQSTHSTEDAQDAQSELVQTRSESIADQKRSRAKKFLEAVFGPEEGAAPARVKGRVNDRPESAASSH